MGEKCFRLIFVRDVDLIFQRLVISVECVFLASLRFGVRTLDKIERDARGDMELFEKNRDFRLEGKCSRAVNLGSETWKNTFFARYLPLIFTYAPKHWKNNKNPSAFICLCSTFIMYKACSNTLELLLHKLVF